MMSWRILLALCVFCAPSSCLAADPMHHEYGRWVGDDRISVQEPSDGKEHGKVVVGDDAFFEATFCSEGSGYYCFFTVHHAFAVPRAVSSEERWTVEGVTFEVVSRGVSVELLGQQLDGLVVIRSPEGAAVASEKPWLYLYSWTHGLVAFGTEDLRATYWLKTRDGFGAGN